MIIDIIDMESWDGEMTNVQLTMVRTAQLKKNEVVEKARVELLNFTFMLMANGTAYSTMLEDKKSEIEAERDRKIEEIRESLELELRYEAYQNVGNESGPYRYPENPNYAISYSQRFLVVRQYYATVTTDPDVRLQMYAGDTLARTYLGEYYDTLYDLIASGR